MLWLVNISGHTSLYCLLNSKVCLNCNVPPPFKPTNIRNSLFNQFNNKNNQRQNVLQYQDEVWHLQCCVHLELATDWESPLTGLQVTWNLSQSFSLDWLFHLNLWKVVNISYILIPVLVVKLKTKVIKSICHSKGKYHKEATRTQ